MLAMWQGAFRCDLDVWLDSRAYCDLSHSPTAICPGDSAMGEGRSEYCAEVVNAIERIRRFAQQFHANAEAALLAGSRSRGTARANSDYDVVLFFPSLPTGAWREVVAFEGQVLEVFCHSLNTFSYFCREIDRPSGKPVLPALVTEGLSVLPPTPTLERARVIAKAVIDAGPLPLTNLEIDRRRHVISDLALALDATTSGHERLATGATLYIELADFALRANGQWSAAGKALPRALAAMSDGLALQFERSFQTLFAGLESRQVNDLIDDVLQDFGGRLREGYRQRAPIDWRDA